MTLTASASGVGDLTNATVTFTDILTNTVLAKGVKMSPVPGTSTGTANTILTLSSGQYGAQEYLIEVSLGSSYKNCQQTGYVSNASGTYCAGWPVVAPTDPAYQSAHPTVTVIIPSTINTMQGTAGITKLSTSAGTYGDATGVTYCVGMKYNNKGTNPQGQIQLVLQRADGTYYVKSNSISSLAFTTNTADGTRDVTIYTKASIYKVSTGGALTSIDGNVTLRLDAHDGFVNGTQVNDDMIGFTVLSSKTSALYYSNNWVYDSATRAYRTVMQTVTGSASTGVVIN